MNHFLGLAVTALSVLLAAIVSGLRLKPYMDAGETYTPPSFALYPALIAAAVAIPSVFLVRKWQGKKEIDIGPVTFSDRQPFIVLGCLLYVTIAVIFFPYRERPQPPPSQPPRLEEPEPQHQPVKSTSPCSLKTFPCMLKNNVNLRGCLREC